MIMIAALRHFKFHPAVIRRPGPGQRRFLDLRGRPGLGPFNDLQQAVAAPDVRDSLNISLRARWVARQGPEVFTLKLSLAAGRPGGSGSGPADFGPSRMSECTSFGN